ncbi:hypothetical protein J6590_042742 [Homalodisca vitripennis]|nr:hypothetical protein J6590_042742 [Homalodisca vitripennis]
MCLVGWSGDRVVVAARSREIRVHRTPYNMAQTLNSETGSLMTTYLILIVLLISLWILYAGIL